MKRYFVAALLALTVVIVAPFLDHVAAPTLPDSFRVSLDPPRVGVPLYAYASRARWNTLVADAMDTLLISPALAQVGGGIFGNRGTAQVIEVGKSGQRFTSICGMLPGAGGANSCGDGTDICAAGSAVASIIDASTSKPYIIHVNPGIYNECVHFDNITDVSLVGSGRGVSIIKPTISAATDVESGVVRFGVTTATRNSTARIEMAELSIRNYAWSSPEAAVQLGKQGGPTVVTDPSSWTDIYVHDNDIWGFHDGWQAYGSKLITDDDVPRARVENNRIIGGDAVAKKGFANILVRGNTVLSTTNLCETTNVTKLIAYGPTAVQAGAGSTTSFRLSVADTAIFNANLDLAGRKATMGGGAGCPSNGSQVWIFDYVASTGIASYAPTTGTSDNANCTYTIDAVTHDNGEVYLAGDVVDALCTEVDESVMRTNTTAATYWKNTCFHQGTTVVGTPSGDVFRLEDNSCTIYVNDFGPALESSACAGQGQVVAFLAYQGTHGSTIIDGLTAVINVNVDLRDANSCVNQAAGISFSGTEAQAGLTQITNSSIVLNNRGDADEGSACLKSISTAAFTPVFNDVMCDANDTVAGFAGTSVTAYQANTSGLKIGNLVSPDPITTTGTITHLAEMGAGLTGSATIDFAVLAVSVCATVDAAAAPATITVTGAADGDLVRLSVPNAANVAGSSFNAWVSAANTVTVQHCCNIAGTCNPASAVFTARVEKP